MLHGNDFHLFRTGLGSWLFHAESHNLFQVSPAAADRMVPDGAHGLDLDLQALRDDFAVLAHAGYLAGYNRERLAEAAPTDGADLALNINLTASCNLGCTYCFAKGGDYGRIRGKLSKDFDVDAILQFVEEQASPGEKVRFEFFGGEPMMNFDTIEALCKRSTDLAETRGLRFLYRISTNLTTRLSDRELSLFERFGFTVSVSIDGGEATHNRNRPNKAGRGSYRAIAENCRKVRGRSENITLVARMTYVPYPGSSLVADIEALHALNIFDWFQVLPATVSAELVATVFGDVFGDRPYQEICHICAEKVDREYERLADQYLALFQSHNRFRGILEIETIVRMILEGEVANGHCSGGRNYFTFSPDQSIMPCHRLVGEADFQVGSFSGGLEAPATLPWRRGINETPVCRDCSIRYICGGGCKQENFVGAGDIHRPDPEKCRFQFRLVHAAVQAVAHSTGDFRARRRDALKDLFVSCGRPTLRTARHHDPPAPDALTYLTPLCDG